MQPTLKMIAENLNLSIGTVQKALNNKGGCSPETQKRIMHEAERIGYSANAAASALRRAPLTIAVLLPEPVNENRFFYQYLWQGIEYACRELAVYRIQLVKHFISPDSDKYEMVLADILNSDSPKIQGVICMNTSNPQHLDLLKQFSQKHISVFIINATIEPSDSYTFCISSNRMVGALSADIFSAIHKYSTGTVLLLGGNKSNFLLMERAENFCTGISRNCPDISIIETYMQNDIGKLRKLLTDYIQKFEDLLGIYAVSARETITMCEAVKDSNLSGRLTTIGTDTFPELLPYFTDDTLTASIYQYPSKQSYHAVRMLVSNILSTEPHSMDTPFSVVPVFKSCASVFCSEKGLL